MLGLGRVKLLNYRDGQLAEAPLDGLTTEVLALVRDQQPSHLLAFDVAGITGHPDHVRATEAALAAGLPVLAWALGRHVLRVHHPNTHARCVGVLSRSNPGFRKRTVRPGPAHGGGAADSGVSRSVDDERRAGHGR